MKNRYYLTSSLPMLKKDERPTLTLDNFMETCGPWLSKSEMAVLTAVSLSPAAGASGGGVPSLWSSWENCLRNRLARARAAKLEKDPEKFVRPGSDVYSEIDRGAQEALSAPNPLEKERILDNLRWKALDHMESGHMFDLDFLCVYKLKLMLREKWMERTRREGTANFEKAVGGVMSEASAEPRTAQ